MRGQILCLILILLSCKTFAAETDIQAAPEKAKVQQEWFVSEKNVDKTLLSRDINLVPERPSGAKDSGLAIEQNKGLLLSGEMAVKKPVCESSILRDRVLEKIAEYYKKNPDNSIIEQRKQALLLKNLTTFKTLDVKNFNQEESYEVADKLVEYKINKGFSDEDISLCQSMGANKMYLLIYPDNNFYLVELINFNHKNSYRPFTFIYD